MPRVNEIRQSVPEWFNWSLLDIILMIDKSKTHKYTPLIVNLVKNSITDITKMNDDMEYINKTNKKSYSLDVDNFSDDENVILYRLIGQIMSESDISTLYKFIEFNDKKIANGVDVQTMKTFSDINRYLSVASLKMISKELSNETKKDYEDDEWLIVRPISYESSMKYGAGTKWCTTSENQPHHFFRYTRQGCLFYIINKNNGTKVGCFYSLHEQNVIEFYNDEDLRVDSMMVDVPYEILSIVRDIIKDNPVSNKNLNLSIWEKSNELHNHDMKAIQIEEVDVAVPHEEPMTEPGYEYQEVLNIEL